MRLSPTLQQVHQDRFAIILSDVNLSIFLNKTLEIIQLSLEINLNLQESNTLYSSPRACLLYRSPVPAMDLKSNRSGL